MFDMTEYLLSSGVVSPQNTPKGTFVVVFKDEPKYALPVSFSSHNVFCQDRLKDLSALAGSCWKREYFTRVFKLFWAMECLEEKQIIKL